MYLSFEIERAIWSRAAFIQQTTSLHERAAALHESLQQYDVDIIAAVKTKSSTVKVFGSYFPGGEICKVILSNRSLVVEPLIGKSLATFLFEVNCTVQHELIHKYQWVHRDIDLHGSRCFSCTPKQAYLAGFDEIETQAHDAAMEVRFYYPNHDPRNVLRGYFNKNRINLPSVNNYMKAFDSDTSHPAVKRFLRKTYSWLDHVSVLRPITYRL